ncbi:carboxylesterase/lipase family protein [Nitrospirillum sp. BR 11163]|uniref:carboxylesterase/lipase family protein n=1 Tax=Nitrospirillum sp. BR 11163 TaxID=3104323 RepID=UPI002AFE88D6|nr:carboxylesterase family protein [Nitrospirillum sp. BR 11163]MEA1672056.1 carboxylesterase family protein [Nitrospirillum sp. BR 11163]
MIACKMLAGAAVALLLLPAIAAAQPILRLDSGEIRGAEKGAVDEFLGIPYAQAPVGPLRWRDPAPVKTWQGVRDATKAPPACYQGPPGGFGPFTSEFLIQGPVAEDCLYLNVWKPHEVNGKLPVFFYIHGGGFGSGSNSIPVYDGSGLASKGAIVVTINYRLGVFGFLAHPELTRESALHSSGNYGLLDMIEALKWVRANIAKFGGDPGDVTIAGQSAGAAAVNDLVVSPLAKGLFQRAVAQSGSGMGIHMPSLAEAETTGTRLAEKLGVRSLAELRAVSAEALQQASDTPPPAPGPGAKPSLPTIAFAPNLDAVVVAGDPDDPAAPVASKVPFLTGFNTDEGILFGNAAMTPADFISLVHERYGTFADRLLALYPHATDEDAQASYKLLARDRYMASLVLWAQRRTAASGQSVYAYMYDHPYPASGGQDFGAFHTAEVPYVMGALGKGGRVFTDRDRAVSNALQAHWLAFMKKGDPSIPGVPWPHVVTGSPMVMGIGDTTDPRLGVSTEERFTVFKDYVLAGGKLSLL